MSLIVQETPSSQDPLVRVVTTQIPVSASQAELVHSVVEEEHGFGLPLHTPPLHLSLTVQGSLSSQSRLSSFGTQPLTMVGL
jgi:hypothetical protein